MGNVVDIHGGGFTGVGFETGPSSIHLGPTDGATNVTDITITESVITCTLPDKDGAWPDSVSLFITTPFGTTVKHGAFTFVIPPPPPAPTVSAVTPNTAKPGGGEMLTIDGADFVNGSGLGVSIDSVVCTSVAWVSATQITCVTGFPGGGPGNVVVTNPDLQTSGSSGDGLMTIITGPYINGIDSPTGTIAGGDTLTITGQGLCSMFGAGATVTIGGNSATVNSGFGGITLNVTTPSAGSVGPADIVVTYLGVDTGISGNGRFTYV